MRGVAQVVERPVWDREARRSRLLTPTMEAVYGLFLTPKARGGCHGVSVLEMRAAYQRDRSHTLCEYERWPVLDCATRE